MGTKSKGKGGSRNSPTSAEKSGFYGNSATGGHVHEDEYDEFTNQSQKRAWLKEQFPDASDDEIDEMRGAVSSWSGSGYEDIRFAQQSGLTDSYSYEKGEVLENMIKGSPKYYGKGKAIYRGINVDEDTYNDIISTLSRGGRISMLGTASWSSKKDVAEDFFTGSSGKNIVFVSEKGTKAGTSIQHLSGYGKTEAEVLVSRRTLYGANRIVEKGSTTYVYVDEYIG